MDALKFVYIQCTKIFFSPEIRKIKAYPQAGTLGLDKTLGGVFTLGSPPLGVLWGNKRWAGLSGKLECNG